LSEINNNKFKKIQMLDYRLENISN